MTIDLEQEQVIDAYVKWRIRDNNWVLIRRDNDSAQFSISKEFGPFEHILLWGGLLLVLVVPLWVSILVWIIMGISYISSGESGYYVDMEKMQDELKDKGFDKWH